jgi:hypothetical protein
MDSKWEDKTLWREQQQALPEFNCSGLLVNAVLVAIVVPKHFHFATFSTDLQHTLANPVTLTPDVG